MVVAPPPFPTFTYGGIPDDLMERYRGGDVGDGDLTDMTPARLFTCRVRIATLRYTG